jgi:hypothetical protein
LFLKTFDFLFINLIIFTTQEKLTINTAVFRLNNEIEYYLNKSFAITFFAESIYLNYKFGILQIILMHMFFKEV